MIIGSEYACVCVCARARSIHRDRERLSDVSRSLVEIKKSVHPEKERNLPGN